MAFYFQENDSIKGLVLITPRTIHDSRGLFMETYKFSDFIASGISENFVQDNQSKSIKNVFRGIHFQRTPKPQGKLVRCVRGSILDYAVDLRPNSSTFKKWVSYELTEANRLLLYIPPGFGHAFLTLSDEAEICYKCTNEYDATLDGGVNCRDSELNLGLDNSILLSNKDLALPYLKDLMLSW